MMALLYTGDCRHAEDAVVDTRVATALDPLITAGDPSSVWRCLASHFSRPDEQTVLERSSVATVGIACLSAIQSQAMALVAVGRDLEEVAAIVEIPPAQVLVEFRTGTAALDEALRSSSAELPTDPFGECRQP